MRAISRRSAGVGASDRTTYGTARGSTKSFLTHHMQQISRAAAMYDAMAILKALTGKKQEMCKSAHYLRSLLHAYPSCSSRHSILLRTYWTLTYT